MEFLYDSVKSNDQSQNVSQIISASKYRSADSNECYSSKHQNGANIRQNMFMLNDDLRMVNFIRNKEDTEAILDPSTISNIKQYNEIDISQFENDMSVKEKNKFTQIQLHPKDQSFRKSSKFDSLKVSTARLNDTIIQVQSVKESQSADHIPDNIQNMYDQQLERESKRLQISEQSPVQKQALLNGSNKLQNLTLRSTKTKLRESLKDIPKSARSSQRLTPPGQNFFLRMKISQITRRFINKIKSISISYNLRQLTKKHYDIINDRSSFYIEHKAKDEGQNQRPKLISYLFSIYLIVYEFLNNIQPLNPESRLSVICDLIYGTTLLGYLFVVPIQLSFMVSFDTFELVVFIIFLINFLLTLNKSYYFEGRIISNRKKILMNFFKTNFFIDILVFISLRLQMFQYVTFLKFFDINHIIKRADNHFQIIRKIPIIFTLVNLVVKMALIAQIAGCTFHYVARLEHEENKFNATWLSAQNMVDQSWQNRYIISIYFAFITMMTVGYGDVTPVNNHERIYVIFMTLLSSGIFGYVVNTIGQLYHQQAQKFEQFQKRKQEINLYMDERKIESETKIKVLNYLEYAFQYQKKKDQNPLVLFQDIPQILVEEICIKYYGRYLFQNKIMKLNFSESSLKALSICMKEKNLAPNEFLFHKGINESKVYFLVSGKIDIVIESKDSQSSCETVSKEGQEIGLRSAFISSERSITARCQKNSNCTLVYFEMDDFKKILQLFPKDYERFCEIRDDIVFNFNTLDTQCPSCTKYDHSISKCPLISLNIQKENFLYKYNNGGEPQSRTLNSVQRRGRKINCLKLNPTIRQKLKQYRMSLVFLIIPELRDNELNFQDRSDKFFYNKMPTVKIMDGGDIEADMEEYNIFDGYDTMAHDDHFQLDEDESDSDNFHLRRQEDEHYLAIQGESGENMLGSSSYSSSQYNQQLQPQQMQIQITTSSNKESNNTPQQLQLVNQTPTSNQKMSLFAKKTSQNIEIPTPISNINNEGQPQVNINQINQPSSRNLSFRRERGDSFYPPKRNSKQYSQQRSLQSRVKSARKNSEIIQHSNKPSNLQVSFLNEAGQDAVEYTQPIFDLFIYDFDRLKIFEKYFPNYNYTNVIKRILMKRVDWRPKKIHKTIIFQSSPKKRLSKKILDTDKTLISKQ